jgi:hypothetical protein
LRERDTGVIVRADAAIATLSGDDLAGLSCKVLQFIHAGRSA